MAKRMNISNEESLEYRKWIDNYKKEFAISTVFSKYCVFAFAVELKKAIDRAKKHYWLCKY